MSTEIKLFDCVNAFLTPDRSPPLPDGIRNICNAATVLKTIASRVSEWQMWRNPPVPRGPHGTGARRGRGRDARTTTEGQMAPEVPPRGCGHHPPTATGPGHPSAPLLWPLATGHGAWRQRLCRSYLRKQRSQSATPAPIRTKINNCGYMKVKIAAAAMDIGRVALNHIPRANTVTKAARMRGVKLAP